MRTTIRRVARPLVRPPVSVVRGAAALLRGYRFGAGLTGSPPGVPSAPAQGRLERYFDAHVEGPGIWKWRHYFDIYEHHLSRFVDREVHLVEIGVYSGGSLGMWRAYLGGGARIYGVDIEQACRGYAEDGIDIIIGDQGSREFWAKFREQVPNVDVVIDDGGHLPSQQIATLEGLLPHMRRGGVYICEDIMTSAHPFHSYLDGLTRPFVHAEEPAGIHQHVASIHRYPQVAVIVKPERPVTAFEAPRRGTEWQPFL